MWDWGLGQPSPEVRDVEERGWCGVILGSHPTALLSRSRSLEETCCCESHSGVIEVAPGQCLCGAATSSVGDDAREGD